MSCLFISLDYFIKENSYIVRQKICDYLENNNTIIEGLDTKIILDMENTNYVTSMRNPSTWGGAIEIQAACNIWNLRIIVKDIRQNNIHNNVIEFIPINNCYERSISIEWSGGHYEPLRN
jgi:hypothetical protein